MTSFYVCTCYSSICHAYCSYYSRTAFISFSSLGGVTTVWEQLLIESGVWLSGYGMYFLVCRCTSYYNKKRASDQCKCMGCKYWGYNAKTQHNEFLLVIFCLHPQVIEEQLKTNIFLCQLSCFIQCFQLRLATRGNHIFTPIILAKIFICCSYLLSCT